MNTAAKARSGDPQNQQTDRLTLTALEARIGLVDDVNSAFAPHETIVPMTF